jgi:hypothetical protein
MANSKLLKEAIADAKAVKETALANAKLALEEAFTPRLQSILSQKLQAEAEMENDEEEMQNEELGSTGIGSKVEAGYAETPGKNPTLDAHTDLSVGVEKDGGKPEQAGTDYEKVADINEEEGMEGEVSDKDAEIAELKARIAELEGNDSMDDTNDVDTLDMDGVSSDEGDLDNDGDHDMDDHEMEDETDEEEMDLEAIIRELEQTLEGEDSDEKEESMYEAEETEKEETVEEAKDETEEKEATNEEAKEDNKEEMDEVIDLEEILREMEADLTNEAEEESKEDKEEELKEAYATIKSLQTTINEVNLLNAKLLFANKLFRAHNMTNEQKVKVIETLDRTKSVREVKLVYSTLAENFKYTSITKTAKKSITEGIASKVTKSTKPAVAEQKQVIAESADFSDRFKKLAGIIK